jgi:hypothetical protein
MSGRRVLTAGLAVGALVVGLSVPSSASAAFFRTPTGNIICGTGPQAFGGGTSCTVLSEANARGQRIWAMRRRGRVRVFRSRSNAPVEVRVLGYGRSYPDQVPGSASVTSSLSRLHGSLFLREPDVDGGWDAFAPLS